MLVELRLAAAARRSLATRSLLRAPPCVTLRRHSRCDQSTGGTTASGAGTQDPIQKLYVDKIREFAKKSKESSDGMYGASEIEKRRYQDEVHAIGKKFGADKEDFNKYPQLGPYTDPEWKADQP